MNDSLLTHLNKTLFTVNCLIKMAIKWLSNYIKNINVFIYINLNTFNIEFEKKINQFRNIILLNSVEFYATL